MSAKSQIEFGVKHPYDGRPVAASPAARAVYGILASLTDRRGVSQALEDIDQEIQEEIVDELIEIVRTAYEGSAG